MLEAFTLVLFSVFSLALPCFLMVASRLTLIAIQILLNPAGEFKGSAALQKAKVRRKGLLCPQEGPSLEIPYLSSSA